MNDRDFLNALESCTLPESEFTHAAHVRAAYLYLCEHDFAAALSRMAATIRRYATHLGKPDRYHETITVAYFTLIREHLYKHGDGGGWEGFASANRELFEPGLLLRFFRREQLESEVARRIFVLPRGAGALR
jgi:hypothetical protein